MQIANRPNPHGKQRTHPPQLVVIHAMAEWLEQGEVDYHATEFLIRQKLSAHAFVTPSGVIVRARTDGQIAWHARGHNERSLGVEFLVPGVHTYGTFLDAIQEPYLTDAQYAAGVELVRGWCTRMTILEIKRHSDLDPGRKKDPGDGFPWSEFLAAVGRDQLVGEALEERARQT